jgi:hypothetical protein
VSKLGFLISILIASVVFSILLWLCFLF